MVKSLVRPWCQSHAEIDVQKLVAMQMAVVFDEGISLDVVNIMPGALLCLTNLRRLRRMVSMVMNVAAASGSSSNHERCKHTIVLETSAVCSNFLGAKYRDCCGWCVQLPS